MWFMIIFFSVCCYSNALKILQTVVDRYECVNFVGFFFGFHSPSSPSVSFTSFKLRGALVSWDDKLVCDS